jgi:fatty-acyl-CoA synthase
MRAEGGDLSSLRLVVCGGSAVPHALQASYESELGVRILQAWGMTETSPLASVANPPPGVSEEEAWSYRDSQGRLFCAVEGRLTGDSGDILPNDGAEVGEVEVRGPWITGSYYKDDDAAKFHDVAHPDVAEAAVIGVADERWGERPLAAVVLRPGAEVSAEKLRTFMTEQIPRWQLPERWCFVDEVPKTSVGKFSKRQMREAYQRGDYEIVEVR